MRRRTGFTLVEVLVALALTMVIMSIMSAAFVVATQAFTDLKSAGDLAEKLRGAKNVLARDLQCDRYDASDPSVSSWRVSTLWNGGTNPPPPASGVFRIFQGTPDVSEGQDLDGIPSYYQTQTSLHYTIGLEGNKRSDFLSALVPSSSPLTTPQTPPSLSDVALGPPDQRYQDTPNLYNSPNAEVVVFLAPTGDQTDGATGSAQPLFALYRRQFLTVPKGWTPPLPTGNPLPPTAAQASSYLEVSTIPTAGEASAATNLSFNSMADLTMPVKRFWMDRTNLAGVYTALPPLAPPNRYAMMGESNPVFKSADLLLTDVVSFDVRVLVQGSADFEDLYQLTNNGRTDPGTGQPWFFPFNNPSFAAWAAAQSPPVTAPRVFDTWSAGVDPNNPAYNYSTWMTPGTATSTPIYKDNRGNPISIQAIQIVLRVWDFKTKRTRQATIVQQM